MILLENKQQRDMQLFPKKQFLFAIKLNMVRKVSF